MPPREKDATHWLYRLTSDEWLVAAETELRHCAETLGRRAFRPGVTHARRAAGMAWNAVLVASFDERFGRSYMEHVAALANDQGVPDETRQAAQYLRDTPPAPPRLVTLGKPDLGPLAAARIIVHQARSQVAVPTTAN
ncbi:MAG: hypothetical protein ABUL77_02195 [Bacteroidota bacterium]